MLKISANSSGYKGSATFYSLFCKLFMIETWCIVHYKQPSEPPSRRLFPSTISITSAKGRMENLSVSLLFSQATEKTEWTNYTATFTVEKKPQNKTKNLNEEVRVSTVFCEGKHGGNVCSLLFYYQKALNYCNGKDIKSVYTVRLCWVRTHHRFLPSTLHIHLHNYVIHRRVRACLVFVKPAAKHKGWAANMK